MSDTNLLVVVLVFGASLLALVAARVAFLRIQSRFTEHARLSLDDMFVFIDPRSVFRGTLIALLLVPVLVWLVSGSLFLAGMAAVCSAVGPRVSWAVMRRRRLTRLTLQLPDGITMMAGTLRAGGSLPQAFGMVVRECGAPLSQEFSMLLREQRLGVPLEESLGAMGTRLATEEIDLFVSAVTIAKEVGGNLSETLDRLASALRAKAAMEGKISALTSQGKLQGIVVGLLPVILGAVLYAMDPAAMMPMFTTYYGWGVIAGVSVMLMLGGIFIRKIVSIDV